MSRPDLEHALGDARDPVDDRRARFGGGEPIGDRASIEETWTSVAVEPHCLRGTPAKHQIIESLQHESCAPLDLGPKDQILEITGLQHLPTADVRHIGRSGVAARGFPTEAQVSSYTVRFGEERRGKCSDVVLVIDDPDDVVAERQPTLQEGVERLGSTGSHRDLDSVI